MIRIEGAASAQSYDSLKTFYSKCIKIDFRGVPCAIVSDMPDCNIIVYEFKHQFPYYVYFWTNTLGKGMNHFIPSSYELNSTSTVLL